MLDVTHRLPRKSAEVADKRDGVDRAANGDGAEVGGGGVLADDDTAL